MTAPQDLADRLGKFKAEFEAFVTSDDEYGDQEFGQFCQKNHALILASLRRAAPASGEMREAQTVSRNEALETAALIAARYGEPYIAADIRALITRTPSGETGEESGS